MLRDVTQVLETRTATQIEAQDLLEVDTERCQDGNGTTLSTPAQTNSNAEPSQDTVTGSCFPTRWRRWYLSKALTKLYKLNAPSKSRLPRNPMLISSTGKLTGKVTQAQGGTSKVTQLQAGTAPHRPLRWTDARKAARLRALSGNIS